MSHEEIAAINRETYDLIGEHSAVSSRSPLEKAGLPPPAAPDPVEKAEKQRPPVVRMQIVKFDRTESALKVDFHGLTCEEAVDLLQWALNAAALQGNSKVFLVHGIGTGKIKKALLCEIDRHFAHFVREIEPNRRNRGETLVHLR